MATNRSRIAEDVDWMSRFSWAYGSDLDIEWRQALQEGRDLPPTLLRNLKRYTAYYLIPGGGFTMGKHATDATWWARTWKMLDAVQACPLRDDYPYQEPTEFADIQSARPAEAPILPAWNGNEMRFRALLHAGFLGRHIGSHLGAPIEGFFWKELQIHGETTGDWPFTDYLRRPTAEEAKRILAENPKHHFVDYPQNELLRGEFDAATPNDDIDFTLLAFQVVKQHGANYTPHDVAAIWNWNLPDACSAEAVASRNIRMGYAPPLSGTRRNPYREWIGAQIRADYYGYANPGNPPRAAEWAYRDAIVSHTRNGVYGAMWVAAMIAAAYVTSDPETIVRAGLAQIPAQSRLAEALRQVIADYHAGRTLIEMRDRFHERYNELHYQDWCHVIPNAEICAIALLWGEGDFTKTIAYSVMLGLDTDCNGATVGSVIGIRCGLDGIPSHWSTPFHDRYRMPIRCLGTLTTVSISETAQEMADVALRCMNDTASTSATTRTMANIV